MITKTDFLEYLKAPLHLWAEKHNRIETVPSDLAIHLMTQGTAAEKYARQFIESSILNQANTESLLWQHTFTHDHFSFRADALIYKNRSDSYDLYEVKSGTGVKPENYYDAAYQYVILSQNHTIDHVFILHLNKNYTLADDLDVSQLFTAEDITEKVHEYASDVKAALTSAWDTAQAPSPEGISGCLKPAVCPCPALCHPNLPEYSIYDIPRLTENKKVQLLEHGIQEISAVPADFALNAKQRHIVDIIQSNSEHIDHGSIKKEFDQFVYPLYFLDYETCIIAVPRFPGYHPQQHAVFQYSLHRMDFPNAPAAHLEHLSIPKGDPSFDLLSRLREDIGDSGTIFAWNKPFEASRNKEMALLHPEYKEFLLDINERLYDLADFVKNGFYLHPGFKGRWSIKNVLPVMAPELNYDDMPIGKGDQAMRAWWDIINGKLSLEEVEKMSADLLAYCKLDTLAMVRIWQKLRDFIHIIN